MFTVGFNEFNFKSIQFLTYLGNKDFLITSYILHSHTKRNSSSTERHILHLRSSKGVQIGFFHRPVSIHNLLVCDGNRSCVRLYLR